MELLFQSCREQFVALHDSPILDNLAKEFEEKFGHLTYVKFVCVCVCVCVCVYVCWANYSPVATRVNLISSVMKNIQ